MVKIQNIVYFNLVKILYYLNNIKLFLIKNHYVLEENKLIDYILNLRKNKLKQFKNKFKNKSILFHLPLVDNGAYKYIVENMCESLKYTGINVLIFDSINNIKLDINKKNIVLLINTSEHINKIQFMELYGLKDFFDIHLIGILNKMYYNNKLSFSNFDIIKYFDICLNFGYGLNKQFNNISNLLNYPFVGNPITFYPKYKFKLFDYLHVGTNNFYKSKNIFNFLKRFIFNKNYGLIDGVDFKYFAKNSYNPKYLANLYSKTKIVLNIHVDIQKHICDEWNERDIVPYFCGSFVLNDYTKLFDVKNLYTSTNIINTKTYFEKYNYFLKNTSERQVISKQIISKLYKDKTYFDLIKKIIKILFI